MFWLGSATNEELEEEVAEESKREEYVNLVSLQACAQAVKPMSRFFPSTTLKPKGECQRCSVLFATHVAG